MNNLISSIIWMAISLISLVWCVLNVIEGIWVVFVLAGMVLLLDLANSILQFWIWRKEKQK